MQTGQEEGLDIAAVSLVTKTVAFARMGDVKSERSADHVRSVK